MATRAELRLAKIVREAKAARVHERYVQKTYGLAPGEYDAMLQAQDGRCALCMRVPRNRRLAVDHDHRTGKNRSLLCYLCNRYLGQWEFDPITAINASQYLAAIFDDFPLEDNPITEAA